MLKGRLIILKLTVVALLVMLFSTANAEWKNVVSTQGNNIGAVISTTTGGPLDCLYYGLPPTPVPPRLRQHVQNRTLGLGRPGGPRLQR